MPTLTPSQPGRGAAVRQILWLSAYTVVTSAVVLELFFLVMLHLPRLTASSPRAVRRLVQQVYRHFNRGLIQFDPTCARYDSGLTYTLRPGGCTFENLEFKTTYHINHVGVRDEEASLEAPDVIVLGDSHAMGWGVEQNEATPQILARTTGLKVLNAGVSSYGTAREMTMLDRLDTSRLRVLVIQYADNDLVENRAFRDHGGHLPITSEPEYQKIVRQPASQRSYYPGKYIYRLFMKVSRLEGPEPVDTSMEPAPPTEEAALFLDVVASASHKRLDGVQLIVYEVNEQIRPPRPFIAALEQVQRRAQYPEFIRNLIALDITPLLTTDDFYVLDDHMNRRGHEKVAGALARLIRN